MTVTTLRLCGVIDFTGMPTSAAGAWSRACYDVHDDGLYVAGHVLGPGRLRIGGFGDRVEGRPQRSRPGPGGLARWWAECSRSWRPCSFRGWRDEGLGPDARMRPDGGSGRGARVTCSAAVAADEPITVTPQVRHVTTVVLPEPAEIGRRLRGVRPLVEGSRSNVLLLTAGLGSTQR